MARARLYQSEVKKARDALIAQGRHPSVDAVRVELGNTGSKTTIHKYLKELEAEDGGAGGRKASIGEALQDLVERLAARLHEEADARIATAQAQHSDQARGQAEALQAVQRELADVRSGFQQATSDLERERLAHAHTTTSLQAEAVARATAEQQVADLKERLLENEGHRRSLEEKHVHARDALEHYRQSVKEQRDQDQRRHEQQVQQLQADMRQLQQSLIVKQEAETRLNQDGARLVAELSQARQSMYDLQAVARQQEKKIEQLQSHERRAATLEAQLAGKDSQSETLMGKLESIAAQRDEMSGRVRELELALATAQATLAAQQDIAAELRSYMVERAAPAGPATAL